MPQSDAVALVTAVTALVAAVAGLIVQVRRLRADIVASVQEHAAITASALVQPPATPVLREE